MSHTVAGTPTNYAWDVASTLPVVLQDGTNTYVYGLDLISATDGSGNQTYFTYDGLGSTRDLTDGSGAVTGAYAYDVFGATLSGPAANQWQFTGEQRDADSGLYYLRARYYDPTIGRLISRDPLPGSAMHPQSQNPYAYAWNNPATLTDASGMCPGSCEGGMAVPPGAEAFAFDPYDNPDLALARFLNSLIPDYDPACIRNPVCANAQSEYLRALGRLVPEILQLRDCAAARRGFVAGGTLLVASAIYLQQFPDASAAPYAVSRFPHPAVMVVVLAEGLYTTYALSEMREHC